MPEDKRPNILLITPDQMRGDAMGCAGNPVVKTPNLDRLAAGGCRFTTAYAQNPVCCPSRASFITGQYNHAHGVRDNSFVLPTHIATMPAILGKAGYRTASVGKMHFNPFDALYGFQERRIAEDKSAPYNDDYRNYLEAKGIRHLLTDDAFGALMAGKMERIDQVLMGMTSPLDEEDYIDNWCCRETIRLIEREDARPFFIWLGFPSPHLPTDPPKPWAQMYDPESIPLPERHPEEWESKPPEHRESLGKSAALFTDANLRRFVAHYYGMVSLIDKCMGDIIEALKAAGKYENTIILFSSDHGDYAGDHGRVSKNLATYDCLVRIPMIIHWPAGVKPGQISDALVESVDVLPTFLDYAGVETPWGVQGRSIRPLLEGSVAKVRDYAFSETYYQKMVRSDRYKLIYYAGKPYGELYDMHEDPGEYRNLYASTAHAAIRRKMEADLLEFLVATENPLPACPPRSVPSGVKEPWRGSC